MTVMMNHLSAWGIPEGILPRHRGISIAVNKIHSQQVTQCHEYDLYRGQSSWYER